MPARSGDEVSGGPLELDLAVAKVSKYASRESGDTVEVTERPHGGISAVLADGQGSGRGAKALSNLAAKKAINLLADGTRDGAAARAVHDYLFAYRHGQVSAELVILSADLVTRTIVVSRNTHCPALLVTGGSVEVWSDPANPVGLYPNTKPVIRELPITSGTVAVACSDGLVEAGRRRGRQLDAAGLLGQLAAAGATAQRVADALLEQALALDDGRPHDDMSVVVLAVRPLTFPDGARRLRLLFPLP